MLKKANKPKLKNDKKTISEQKRIYTPVCTNVRSANKKVVFTFSNITYVGLIIDNLFTYMQKGLGTYASSGRQTCKYTYTDTAGHVKGCSMTRCEAKIDCHQQ